VVQHSWKVGRKDSSRLIGWLIGIALISLSAGVDPAFALSWQEQWAILMEDPEQVRDSLPPLSFSDPQAPSPAVVTYFNSYDLTAADAQHLFGTFQSGDFSLAANIFIPASPRGTVMLLHGFLDHTGTISDAVHHLLRQGYAVAAYDMPGHGLSNGRRAHIDDFADYERALNDFLHLCQQSLPPPHHAVAHSTGATVLVSHLLAQGDEGLGNVVLVAPLVRSVLWHLSTISADVIDELFNNVPRVFRDNTSDEAFLQAVHDDPLQARKTSLGWVNALVDWNKRLAEYPPSEKSLLIIQGDEDTIIDWDYNLEVLQGKFPNASVVMIEGGKHQLLGESPAIRQQVFTLIDQALEQPLK
jgi:alpha-beta hydrolase superfamily lysophospholipase